MKNSWVYGICGIVAVAALAAGLVVTSGNRRAAAEAAAKKARSEERAHEAKARAAEEATKVAKAQARVAEAEKESKESARKAAEADAVAAKADEARAAAEAQKAQALAAEADAKRKVAEAERDKAQAERDKAKHLADEAEAKKATAEAEALGAQEAREAQEVAAKTVKDALTLEELRKKQYAKLLEEVTAQKAELDERERALRPPKTVQDLLEAQGGDLFAEEEYEDASATAGFTRKRKVRRILPENDRTLSRATRELARADRIANEQTSTEALNVRSNLVAKLEALMHKALSEDRVADAEFHLKSIRGLYPDYVPSKMPVPATVPASTNVATEAVAP